MHHGLHAWGHLWHPMLARHGANMTLNLLATDFLMACTMVLDCTGIVLPPELIAGVSTLLASSVLAAWCRPA